MKSIKKKHGAMSFLSKAQQKLKRIVKILGPGFITGSADDDPSGIGTYSVAGAQYGPLLLWLVPLQLPLMYAIQNMCARIGLVTGKGLAANMKLYFPKALFYSAIGILCIANSINIGADISIMAASIRLLVGYNIHFWAILTTIVIIAMEILIPYRIYSKMLLALSFFLLSYAVTALITVDSWLEIIQYTFTPHIQWDREFLVVMAGCIGTTISPYLFFWQASQEIEEKLDHKTKSEVERIIQDMPRDTFVGMFFSQLMALFIIVTCYIALHKNGITQITSAYDAAIALKPFAGDCASLVFSLGIIGAGLLGIPVLAGSSAYALSEVFDKKWGLSHRFGEAKFFYIVLALSTLVGLSINFIGINPIKALLYAAVINCVVAVPLVLFVIILANKKELMGKYANGYFLNILGCATFILMFLAAIPVLCYGC